MARSRTSVILAFGLMLAACQSGAEEMIPGDSPTDPYAGISPEEVVQFTGTEPFWGGQVSGQTLTYSTPENPDGATIEVERFAGRNGLSFSGTLDGADFIMTVTPGQCNDGMSSRTYPFTATLQVRGEVRQGCAWTEEQPFQGPGAP